MQQDGTVILQAFDKLIPGSVSWRRVNKPKPVPVSPTQQSFDQGDEDDEDLGPVPHAGLSRFKAVENTNYAVDLAKANKMHMVGIQGADIVDGRRTLVLGLVWQIMRYVPQQWSDDCTAKIDRLLNRRTMQTEHFANPYVPYLERASAHGSGYPQVGTGHCGTIHIPEQAEATYHATSQLQGHVDFQCIILLGSTGSSPTRYR